MDKMFESTSGSGGFGSTEFEPISNMIQGLSKTTRDVYSFGKFALGLNGRYGMSEELMNHYNKAMEDPYNNGPFKNRV